MFGLSSLQRYLLFFADEYEPAERICGAAEDAPDEIEKHYPLPLRDVIYNKQTLKETVNLAEG